MLSRVHKGIRSCIPPRPLAASFAHLPGRLAKEPDYHAHRRFRQGAIFFLDSLAACIFVLVVKTGSLSSGSIRCYGRSVLSLSDVHTIPPYLRQFGPPLSAAKYSRAVFRARSPVPIGQTLPSRAFTTLVLTLKSQGWACKLSGLLGVLDAD